MNIYAYEERSDTPLKKQPSFSANCQAEGAVCLVCDLPDGGFSADVRGFTPAVTGLLLRSLP